MEKNEKIPPLVLEQENMDGTESNDSSRKIIVPNAKVSIELLCVIYILPLYILQCLLVIFCLK